MSTHPSQSSIYSRSLGSEKFCIPQIHRRTRSNISSEPDYPQITDVDHRIGDVQGLSTALETTASRLQISKAERRCSEIERQKSLEKELIGLKWENEFYGECFDLYKALVLASANVSQELSSRAQSSLLEYYFDQANGATSREFILQGVKDLDAALSMCRAGQVTAAEKWMARWEPKRISTLWI